MSASATWTVHYKTAPEGYDAELTLSGDVREVMMTARQVLYDLARLSKAPMALPTSPATVDAEPTAQAVPAHSNGNGNGNGNPDWCAVHHCEMQRRSSNGETWFSHRTPDGAWCRGKVAKAVAP